MRRVNIRKILVNPVQRADLIRRACAFLRCIGRYT
jgi:hypothetical protein